MIQRKINSASLRKALAVAVRQAGRTTASAPGLAPVLPDNEHAKASRALSDVWICRTRTCEMPRERCRTSDAVLENPSMHTGALKQQVMMLAQVGTTQARVQCSHLHCICDMQGMVTMSGRGQGTHTLGMTHIKVLTSASDSAARAT